MFKCQNCSTTVPAGQPMNKVVTEKRHKNYENFIKRGMFDKGRMVYSEGWEIVKEIAACPACFTTSTGMEPKVREVTPPKKRWVPNNERSERPRKPFKKPFNKNQDRRPPQVEKINPVKIVKS